MTDCERTIEALAAGSGEAGEHLKSCAACRAEEKAFAESWRLFRESYAAEPLPAALWENPYARKSGNPWRWAPWALGLAAAALILVFLPRSEAPVQAPAPIAHQEPPPHKTEAKAEGSGLALAPTFTEAASGLAAAPRPGAWMKEVEPPAGSSGLAVAPIQGRGAARLGAVRPSSGGASGLEAAPYLEPGRSGFRSSPEEDIAGRSHAQENGVAGLVRGAGGEPLVARLRPGGLG